MPGPPRVVSLHRYPVKSLLGVSVESLAVDERGCVGDRLWSVRTVEGKIGSGKTTRRFATVPGLLTLRAAEVHGQVVVAFPDGTTCDVGSPEAATRLSQHVGLPLTFARETSVSHFDDGPVTLLGEASVAAVAAESGADVDPTRFRANVVLGGTAPLAEDAWAGRDVSVGGVGLHVSMAQPRCVMVDMETADLPEQPGTLLAVGRVNHARLGVVATVVTPGRISIGDVVQV